MVEGASYRMYFLPQGHDRSISTHISVGVMRNSLMCLNLDTPDEYTYKITMLHSSDHSKDFPDKHTGKHEHGFHSPTFYKIAHLEQDGFINPYGSLRFEFSIERP